MLCIGYIREKVDLISTVMVCRNPTNGLFPLRRRVRALGYIASKLLKYLWYLSSSMKFAVVVIFVSDKVGPRKDEIDAVQLLQ